MSKDVSKGGDGQMPSGDKKAAGGKTSDKDIVKGGGLGAGGKGGATK